ncbi:MAG: hypothetical protein DMG41_13610 [Acidobacteria bacterium]|nr:MAG: hypothetical protein AUH13_25150 [Acidobacteria bacterium 13_2_20CM_58_27]PYT87815.1 MAG: hypothetical protein DMG41_13610 [Acidobacteriota bacterium]
MSPSFSFGAASPGAAATLAYLQLRFFFATFPPSTKSKTRQEDHPDSLFGPSFAEMPQTKSSIAAETHAKARQPG